MVEAKTRVEWPEESGGAEAVAWIIDRCRVLWADPSRIEYVNRDTIDWNQDPGLASVDYPLYQLLEPERQHECRLSRRGGCLPTTGGFVVVVSTNRLSHDQIVESFRDVAG